MKLKASASVLSRPAFTKLYIQETFQQLARSMGKGRIYSGPTPPQFLPQSVLLVDINSDLEDMRHQILLIEDDHRLAEMLRDYLGGADFVVRHADSGDAGLQRHAREKFDAIVLDIMLPDVDGLEVCRRIRAHAATPIVMLTARGNTMDRIVGLELGADDYLPKPFEPRELLARLRAVLRRHRSGGAGDVLVFGRLEIDCGCREARLDGVKCGLTNYQFDLLVVLAERAGRVMERDDLLDRVKGETLEAFDRSIDVHISRIRAKIEDDPKNPRRIITVRGTGYVFARVQS